MIEIRLEANRWVYDADKPIGNPGGFGSVYEGLSSEGQEVAVKKLHIGAEQSAHREFRVALELAANPRPHVIPTFDSGEDANTGSYFIVMARAAKSLQSDISAGYEFSVAEVIDILKQICLGLAELDGLVHRDLKPANILLHDGLWKIADFGIARFLEESTSLNTLKECLSPQYAAPEQWRFETSTAATDVYALGCIGYCLLCGHPPFGGPTTDKFRNQHLNIPPDQLADRFSPSLRTLISMLLRKAPEARPSLSRAHRVLGGITPDDVRSRSAIAEAAARLEHARSLEEAAESERVSMRASRERLAESAHILLCEIMSRLRDKILTEAPFCSESKQFITLGSARIYLPPTEYFNTEWVISSFSFPRSKLDVVLAKSLSVIQVSPNYAWNSSLLYCRFPQQSEYRWHEISFWSLTKELEMPPFDLQPANVPASARFSNLDEALSSTLGRFQVAFGPVPIDDENESDFLERWMTVFAAGAEANLHFPSRLPLAEDYWKHFKADVPSADDIPF